MNPEWNIPELARALLFLPIGAALLAGALVLNRLLRRDQPGSLKSTTYECGEVPVGYTATGLNSRVFRVGLVFLVFEAELLFLFPWLLVLRTPAQGFSPQTWAWICLAEMALFILILLAGLLYAYKNGDLDWSVPQKVKSNSWKLPVAEDQYLERQHA